MAQEERSFLDEVIPTFNEKEKENLYRHFLMYDMPEDDDEDEDFEPGTRDEDDERDDGGDGDVRRRSIQTREVMDLLQDAYKQLGLPKISREFREKLLNQFSMHFQLLVQTAVLGTKTLSYEEERKQALGILEHLASNSGRGRESGTRTRAMRTSSSDIWQSTSPSIMIPGLNPRTTLGGHIQEAGDLNHPRGNPQQAVERLISLRGGVIWSSLLPRRLSGGVSWDKPIQRSTRGSIEDSSLQKMDEEGDLSCVLHADDDSNGVQVPSVPSTFSLLEDRLLCRGIYLFGIQWADIKGLLLPHRSPESLHRRFSLISGWAPSDGMKLVKSTLQTCGLPWTHDEDVKLWDAVKEHGTRWARISRSVMPYRGKVSLRSRWVFLQGILGDGAFGPSSIGGVDARLEKVMSCHKPHPPEIATASEDKGQRKSRGESLASTPNLILLDGIIYAEDELSGDSENDTHAQARTQADERTNTTCSLEARERLRQAGQKTSCAVSNKFGPERPTCTHQCPFEEDELSDDGSFESEHGSRDKK